MAHESSNKDSAQLQNETEMQRSRVEHTIAQIQDKLSPGQLVDELLAYTKNGGGAFVSSLQRNVTANPLPVALMGVSLAWLMAKPAGAGQDDGHGSSRHWDSGASRRRGYAGADDEDEDYPVTIVSGTSLRRLSHDADDDGHHFSEFADEAGKKFRALSDESGNRAGHFIDETGRRFKGFTNAAGERIEHFRDETGNMLDEATGWASHTWKGVRQKVRDAGDAVGTHLSDGRDGAARAGSAIRGQVESLNREVLHHFRDQPLVGGALAFALGAALGSALPHTRQEDALMGDAADGVKQKLGEQASDYYDKGKKHAAELYDATSEKAGELYKQAKDSVDGAVQASQAGPN